MASGSVALAAALIPTRALLVAVQAVHARDHPGLQGSLHRERFQPGDRNQGLALPLHHSAARILRNVACLRAQP
jgi:hypothetical protein